MIVYDPYHPHLIISSYHTALHTQASFYLVTVTVTVMTRTCIITGKLDTIQWILISYNTKT